jgi:hypothetical protein
MKPKTFNQLWNLQVIKRILKEYLASSAGHLCFGSQTFVKVWNTHHRLQLQKLALAFSPTDKGLQEVIHAEKGSCLFYNFGARQTRIDFLNHEIKRLTK